MGIRSYVIAMDRAGDNFFGILSRLLVAITCRLNLFNPLLPAKN